MAGPEGPEGQGKAAERGQPARSGNELFIKENLHSRCISGSVKTKRESSAW